MAVPRVPGVPSLRSYAISSIALLALDAVRIILGQTETRWGIFLAGLPVLVMDSTVSFELKQDFPISDYPVESGGFQTYNKVQLPKDIRMRFSAGGSESNRQAFLTSINAVINTTDLYDVVTPEEVYLNYCFTHRDFTRTSQNGVGLIVVDLWLTEVREKASATFTNTQQPGVSAPRSNGVVQSQPLPDLVQPATVTQGMQ